MIYSLHNRRKALDAAGNETLREVTIRRDTTAPQVVSIAPENGAEKVPVTASVQVTYSEPLSPASVTAAAARVMGPEGVIPSSAQLSDDGRVLTVAPAAPFDFLTVIRVEAGGDLSFPLTDIVGHQAPKISASFKTAPDHYYLYGQVLGEDFLPIVGAKVLLKDVSQGERGADAGTVLQAASTDTNGYFEMEDPPPGGHLLMADARDVQDGSGLKFEIYSRKVFIRDGEDTRLSPPLALPPMRPETASYAQAGGPSPIDFNGAFQTENQGSLVLETQKAGSLTFPDGKRDGLIQAAQVPIQSIPPEIREGATGAIVGAFDLQPSGTQIYPPAKLCVPNEKNLPVGTKLKLYSYSHDLGAKEDAGDMEVVATETDADGTATATQICQVQAKIEHFSMFSMEMSYGGVLPAGIGGYVLPVGAKPVDASVSPPTFQGIPGINMGVVGPSEACSAEQTRHDGHWGARCLVPVIFHVSGGNTGYDVLATEGLVWAEIPISTGRRVKYIYFQRYVGFIPGERPRVDITVDVLDVRGHARLYNLKACDGGPPGSPLLPASPGADPYEGCTVVARSRIESVEVQDIVGEDEETPGTVVTRTVQVERPWYDVHLSSWSSGWPAPIPDGVPVTATPAEVLDDGSLAKFRVDNKDPNLKGLALPAERSEAGWVEEVTQGDLFCNTTVYILGEKPQFRNSEPGPRSWASSPIAVLHNRADSAFCKPYSASESMPGDFRAEPGVDMFNGVSPAGGSTAKVRVASNGEIFFDYFAVARPLFGSNTGLSSQVNKCLESEEAFRACTDPRDPAFSTTAGNAEFFRRLAQVRFAPGMHLLAVVHHSTSGYIGRQEIEIPSAFSSRTSGGTRTAFFDDLQGPTFTPSRSVRMLPPLVKITTKVTQIEDGTLREFRLGTDGTIPGQDGDVLVWAIYRASLGWDHFCGPAYSLSEANDYWPPYRAETFWRSANLSEQVPIPEARQRWSLCEGMAPGQSFGLDSFRNFAQQDVVPETPAADRILASTQGTAGGTLPPYLDSDHDGNPDVWMGGFLFMDGREPQFFRVRTDEDFLVMPSAAGMQEYAMLRIGHNQLTMDPHSFLPLEGRAPRLENESNNPPGPLMPGHQAAYGVGPHIIHVFNRLNHPVDVFEQMVRKLALLQQSAGVARRPHNRWPSNNLVVVSDYNAISRNNHHSGMDIRNHCDENVYAAQDGTVTRDQGADREGGNQMYVTPDAGDRWGYAHTAPTPEIATQLDGGQRVTVHAGDQIGISNGSGGRKITLQDVVDETRFDGCGPNQGQAVTIADYAIGKRLGVVAHTHFTYRERLATAVTDPWPSLFHERSRDGNTTINFMTVCWKPASAPFQPRDSANAERWNHVGLCR